MPALTHNSDGTPHIHAYQRVRETDSRKPRRYFCTHPDCPSIVGRNLLAGKRTLCGVCKINETIFDKENLRRETPRCIQCSNTAKAAAVREKQSVLEAIFGGQK
jgi:hypothetical protein